MVGGCGDPPNSDHPTPSPVSFSQRIRRSATCTSRVDPTFTFRKYFCGVEDFRWLTEALSRLAPFLSLKRPQENLPPPIGERSRSNNQQQFNDRPRKERSHWTRVCSSSCPLVCWAWAPGEPRQQNYLEFPASFFRGVVSRFNIATGRTKRAKMPPI